MKKVNILAWLIIILLLAVGLLLFGRYRMSRKPTFLFTKLDQLMGNEILIDSIGGSKYFESQFNESDFENSDTLRYTIKIVGNKKELFYKATHVRRNGERNEWTLIDEKLIIE
ncbi:MAG: hypothetical protein ABIR06_10325 [Cyclobacteriaceae bacterium]